MSTDDERENPPPPEELGVMDLDSPWGIFRMHGREEIVRFMGEAGIQAKMAIPCTSLDDLLLAVPAGINLNDNFIIAYGFNKLQERLQAQPLFNRQLAIKELAGSLFDIVEQINEINTGTRKLPSFEANKHMLPAEKRKLDLITMPPVFISAHARHDHKAGAELYKPIAEKFLDSLDQYLANLVPQKEQQTSMVEKYAVRTGPGQGPYCPG